MNELAEMLKVSYRTVYRDKEILEKTGFKIELTAHNRYKLSSKKDITDRISFTKEEANLLHTALFSVEEDAIARELKSKIAALSNSHVSEMNASFSRNVSEINSAIKLRKQVYLINYYSPNSETTRTRFVEPFAFNRYGDAIKAFEPSSKLTKSFKIARIGEVQTLDQEWEFEHLHEQAQSDIFGFNLDQPISVKLMLTDFAAHLLSEEFPQIRVNIEQISPNKHLLDFQVGSIRPLARLILGLLNDVQIVSPLELHKELYEYIKDSTTLEAILNYTNK